MKISNADYHNVRMPAEYERHMGTALIWPFRPGSWGKDRSKAEKEFLNIIDILSNDEEVFVLVRGEDEARVNSLLPGKAKTVSILTDDSWARDMLPTFVDYKGKLAGVCWGFNSWGGSYDGLYEDYENDRIAAETFCKYLGVDYFDESTFILEGGSIHSNGKGKLLTTEACLLSKGRNPFLTKADIENHLKEVLNLNEVIWLPRGIYNDETNEHVDNVAAFLNDNEIVMAVSENPKDPQFQLSESNFKYLNEFYKELTVHKLPVPDIPVTVTEKDMENYVFSENEDNRETGERLAASYVNFYIGNRAVLLPQFGGENKESDERALEIMRGLFENREVIPVESRNILLGGGNIHCITQQIPEVS